MRFTDKGEALHAIVLDPSPASEVVLEGLEGVALESVDLLGSDAPLRWSQEGAQLRDELRLAARAWDALLMACCCQGEDVAVLDRVWQRIPGAAKKAHPGLQRRYIACLAKMDAHSKAQRLIVEQLDREWDDALVSLLSTLSVSRADKVLRKVERWLETRGRDQALLLCAGRLALHEKDWNKAQEYFQEAHQVAPNAEICMELARFHQASGDPKRAMEFMREAALLGAGDLPQLPLPESALPAATPRQLDIQ